MDPTNSLEPVTDPTGQLSQEELNAVNISNLIDAVNGLTSSSGNILQQPTYIMVNDGNNNRALVGYNQVTGTWGIFATPPGTDLLDANTPQQLALSSDFSQLIVTLADSYTYSGNLAPNTYYYQVTVPHNLGYIPIAIVYLSNSGTNYPIPAPIQYTLVSHALNIQLYADFYVDNTNIYFNLTNTTASTTYDGPFTWQYYLLAQTA